MPASDGRENVEHLIERLGAWIRDQSRHLASMLDEQRVSVSSDEVPSEVANRLTPESLTSSNGPLRTSQTESVRLQSTLNDAEPIGTVVPPTVVPGHGSRGRFQTLRPHATGGLGQVSVALDLELSREVALKEMHPEYVSDSSSRERFVLEAEVTGRLEHPGIVPVYAFGYSLDGRPYYAMRFVRGESLKAAIDSCHRSPDDGPGRADRRLGLRRLLGQLISVCNAIEYAHSRGILHRDLKPANIMVGRYGETMVVDWGLAKAIGRRESASEEASLKPGSAPDATRPGSIMGTPEYMSPEQAAGDLEQLGPPSDVYSLGATLYHVLCGRSPFSKMTLENILVKVHTGEFPRPSAVQPDVPAPLEAICLKAMALKPADRYPTPRALADDLEHWLADEPVSARRDSASERLGRWTRKHRGWVLAGSIAAAAVLLASTTAAFAINVEQKKTEQKRQEALRSAEAARKQEGLAIAARKQSETDRLRAVAKEQEARRQEASAIAARKQSDADRLKLEAAQRELAKQIGLLGLQEQLRKTVQSKPLLREIAAERIASLQEKARIPVGSPDENAMQTFQAYANARPDRLRGKTTLYIAALGEAASTDFPASSVQDFLTRFFALPVKVLTLPAASLPAAGARQKSGHTQHDARILVEKLLAPHCPEDAAALVAFTTSDAYVEGLNFVFHSVHPQSRSGLVSVHRFGKPDDPMFLGRTLKMAASATAMLLGVRDFSAYDCIMNATNTLPALDQKPLGFCPECEQKVWWLADIDPLDRYDRLAEFADQHKLQSSWRTSAEAIRFGIHGRPPPK